MTYIYNLCIEKGTFPTDLKNAKIIPLPKCKNANNIDNFRPISLLSGLSKPIEKHIHKHLLKYLEKYNLLYSLQSGFRPSHSCQTSLTNITNEWLCFINNDNIVGAVFLDLTKAFDMVDHQILLKKLSAYHFNEHSITFFQSYLKSRMQTVFVHGKYSDKKLVKCGVPQGSVLGPVLFCLFINDLPLHTQSTDTKCHMFADDTSLSTCGKTISKVEKQLQSNINNVSKWCKSNKMALNSLKTKCMLITTRQKHQKKLAPLKLHVDFDPIEQVSEHSLLGVIVDNELKWQSHINKIEKTLSKNIYLMSRLKHYSDQITLKTFFHAHIMPHIDYASTVWDECAEVHLKRLKSLYKRAVTIICPTPNITLQEKLKQLNLFSLRNRFIFNKCTLVHKALHSKAPAYLKELFPTKREHSHRTRKHLLELPKPRIDLFKSSFLFSGSRLWNNLPNSLTQPIPTITFKKNLFKYLKDKNL